MRTTKARLGVRVPLAAMVRTALVCTTCTVTCGSGVRTGTAGIIIHRVHPRIPRARHQVLLLFCGAGRGAASRASVVRRAATASAVLLGVSTTAVFVCCVS